MGFDVIPLTKHTFEDAVSLTGYGKFNLQIIFASGGCLMMVIIETMSMMFIIPSAHCDLNLNLTTKGLLSAISFLGSVSSSHMWGFIADTKGRRNVLIISMVMSCVTSIISSITPYDWMFILIRFINGFFVGGSSAVVYAYVGEFHDKTHRPKVVSWITTFVAFGNMVIPGLAWLILPLDFHFNLFILEHGFRPWRLLVICNSLPSLFFAFWLLRLPESPKYLTARGKCQEALEILKTMYAVNTGNPRGEFPVTEIKSEEDLESNLKIDGVLTTMWKQTAPLFQTPYLLKTLMVCFLQFGTFFSSSGLIMWFPELLNQMTIFASNNPGRPIQLCTSVAYSNYITNATALADICIDSVDTTTFVTTLIVAVLFAVMYIVIGIIINIIGGKKLLITLITIATACGLAAPYIEGEIPSIALIGIFLTVATCVGIINAIVVELYPTQLRAMALSISLMSGRIGAVVGSNAVGPLIYNLCEYMFYIFTVDHLLLILIVVLLPSPSKQKMIQPKV